MKKIFRQIARERSITVWEVREEMQQAIAEAWLCPQNDDITAAYQKQVTCRGEIPTPEELIYYLASRIQKQTNDAK